MSDVGEPGPVDGAPAGEDPLAVLLRVQDLDTALSQLQHRRATMAERRDLEAAEAGLATLNARAAQLTAQHQALLGRQAELEEQIGSLTARRQVLEDRMYGARGSASRDLQALNEEINHLAQRRTEIEEVELELMEQQEPIDADLARVRDEHSQLEAAAESLRAAVAAAELVLGTEISSLESTRGMEAAKLPTDLGDRYEVMRARLGGVGAARLVGNRCDGCHLELPSAEVDRIRHLAPGTVVTCDQCGRILVRAPAPA